MKTFDQQQKKLIKQLLKNYINKNQNAPEQVEQMLNSLNSVQQIKSTTNITNQKPASQISVLNEQIYNLTKKLAKKQIKLKQYKQSLQQNIQSYSNATLTNESLQDNHKKLQEQFKSLQNINSNNEEQIRKLVAERFSLSEQLRKMQSQLFNQLPRQTKLQEAPIQTKLLNQLPIQNSLCKETQTSIPNNKFENILKQDKQDSPQKDIIVYQQILEFPKKDEEKKTQTTPSKQTKIKKKQTIKNKVKKQESSIKIDYPNQNIIENKQLISEKSNAQQCEEIIFNENEMNISQQLITKEQIAEFEIPEATTTNSKMMKKILSSKQTSKIVKQKQKNKNNEKLQENQVNEIQENCQQIINPFQKLQEMKDQFSQTQNMTDDSLKGFLKLQRQLKLTEKNEIEFIIQSLVHEKLSSNRKIMFSMFKHIIKNQDNLESLLKNLKGFSQNSLRERSQIASSNMEKTPKQQFLKERNLKIGEINTKSVLQIQKQNENNQNDNNNNIDKRVEVSKQNNDSREQDKIVKKTNNNNQIIKLNQDTINNSVDQLELTSKGEISQQQTREDFFFENCNEKMQYNCYLKSKINQDQKDQFQFDAQNSRTIQLKSPKEDNFLHANTLISFHSKNQKQLLSYKKLKTLHQNILLSQQQETKAYNLQFQHKKASNQVKQSKTLQSFFTMKNYQKKAQPCSPCSQASLESLMNITTPSNYRSANYFKNTNFNRQTYLRNSKLKQTICDESNNCSKLSRSKVNDENPLQILPFNKTKKDKKQSKPHINTLIDDYSNNLEFSNYFLLNTKDVRQNENLKKTNQKIRVCDYIYQSSKKLQQSDQTAYYNLLKIMKLNNNDQKQKTQELTLETIKNYYDRLNQFFQLFQEY